MKICIETVPHSDRHYESLGDYYMEGDTMIVRVGETGSDSSNIAIAIHEVIEFMLIQRDGIGEEEITAFNEEWEDKKRLGLGFGDEPGNDPEAPYLHQHRAAESVERAVIAALGESWRNHKSL